MFLFGSKKIKNYEGRAKGCVPNTLLLHYTGMQSMQEAKDRLTDPESKVSIHYLVDEDGGALSLVPEDKRAWHAGVAYWRGVTDINSASIGIEIVNPGHEFGYRPFPKDQMRTVLKICREVMGVYDIEHVLGHSDVAPERKQDPGELFDWKWLSENGVGLWPDPTPEEYERAEKVSCNDFDTGRLFITFGYSPMTAFVDVVTAFHRHYYPEIFEVGDAGRPTVETVARLLSLMRQSS